MTLASIRQSIENINYKWNEPKAYLVLVPVVSVIIQKIQLAKIASSFSEITSDGFEDRQKKINLSNKFIEIIFNHFIGSGTVFALSLTATYFFATPLFAGLAGVTAGQMAYTFYNIHTADKSLSYSRL